MDNLVVLHSRRTLHLLSVLLRLLIPRNQLLQVFDRILQLHGLSLTCLKLLIPLVQLSLEVLDIVLGDAQLVLSVLHLCMGVINEVGLDITTTVHPHQLIVQLLDAHLKVVVLLELLVSLLDVVDEAVVGHHLAVVLLQA
jgi:hypothetical protein